MAKGSALCICPAHPPGGCKVTVISPEPQICGVCKYTQACVGAAPQPKPEKFESDTAFMARLDEWSNVSCLTCGCDQSVHENRENGNGVLGDVCWGCFYDDAGIDGEAPNARTPGRPSAPLGKHQHRFKS